MNLEELQTILIRLLDLAIERYVNAINELYSEQERGLQYFQTKQGWKLGLNHAHNPWKYVARNVPL